MRRRLLALVLVMSLTFGTTAVVTVQRAEAFDPLSIGVRIFGGAIKTRVADRAEGIRDVNESRDEALEALNERREIADYFLEQGWMSPEEHAAANAQIDQIATAQEDVARREREIVRFDTDFFRNVRNNVREVSNGNPIAMVAQGLGLPPAAASLIESAINGENPLQAIARAAVTQLTDAGSVEESNSVIDNLRDQIDVLRQAAGNLRGTSKMELLAELTGLHEQLDRITGLPLSERAGSFDAIEQFTNSIEGTFGRLGEATDEIFGVHSPAQPERFGRDAKWQELFGELQRRAGTDIQGAAAAGMAAAGVAAVLEELERNGVDPDTVDINDIVSRVAGAMGEAWRAGERPRISELVPGIVEQIETERIVGQGGTPSAAGDDEDGSEGDDADGNGVPASGDEEEDEEGDEERPPAPQQPAPNNPPPAPAQPSVVAPPPASPSVVVPPPKPPVVVPPPAEPTEVEPPPPPEPSPSLPIVSGSVGVGEGIAGGVIGAFNSTVTITANFETGSVSGTIAGSGSGPENFTCFYEQGGPTIDDATVLYTSTFSGTFSGSLSPGGSFSASMSASGNTSFVLTKPFDHEDCVHLNSGSPGGEGPYSGSGTISGTVGMDGSISVTTSWSVGSASVSGSGAGAGSVSYP